MSEVRKDDYMFIPADEALAPADGGHYQHYVNCWWVVHPEKGLAFFNPKNARTGRRRFGRYGSPQCNADERISRMVGAKTIATLWPEVEIQQLGSVWVPIDISDYRD